MKWFPSFRRKEVVIPEVTLNIPMPNGVKTPIQDIEKTIAELSVAIETDEFVFPEFSSLPIEEAKGMSMKALSITKRIFNLGMDNADS